MTASGQIRMANSCGEPSLSNRHCAARLPTLARRGTSKNVGEIVAAIDVGQSTVSAHLKILAGVRFVLADQRGTATYCRINDVCVECFPTAADSRQRRPAPRGSRRSGRQGPGHLGLSRAAGRRDHAAVPFSSAAH
jgi:DNA-binding transcriptional ArsR family regulator